MIVESPGFRNEAGRFDAKGFDEFVQYEYGNERSYVEFMRRALLGQKMVRLLYSQGEVSEGEARAAALHRLQQVQIAWVALDNTVFLLAPSRIIPGQEGALANAGRGLILVLARFLVLGLVALAGGLAAGLAWWVTQELFGWRQPASIGATFLALWTAIAVVDLALVLAGGAVLRRFDVARDRAG